MVIADIEIYEEGEPVQAKYLVHGILDLFWTDDLDEALEFLKSDIKRYTGEE